MVVFKRSNSGNVFIGALIFLAMAVGFSILVPQIQKSGILQLKTSRARALVSTQELKLRAILMQQSTYLSCNGPRAACSVDPQKISTAQFVKVPGCTGSTDPIGCGIKLSNHNFDPKWRTFQV